MIETDVRGLMRMTRLCLPHIRDGGHIVNIGSVAGREPYENAAVYIAAKYAVRGFTYALRQDLLGRPIHLTTVDPGLVQTNFSMVRFRGDEERAGKVYENVDALKPEDIAECVLFAVTRPAHVNIDELVVKTIDQSTAVRIPGTKDRRMAITILEGSNFCISDQIGDFTFTTSGLYAYDMRFLSRLELTVNGERPLLLSAGKAEYYSAAYFLRNPVAGELPQDSVSVGRHRFVGEGMQDRLRVQNQTHEPVSFELALEFANDFADIFAVKNHDFALGDPRKAARCLRLPRPASTRTRTSSCSRTMEATRERRSSCRSVATSSRGRFGSGSSWRARRPGI